MATLDKILFDGAGASGGVAEGGATWALTFAPRAGTSVRVYSVIFHNTDAAAKNMAVGISSDEGTTVRRVAKLTLQPDDTLVWDGRGESPMIVLRSSDRLLVDAGENVNFVASGEESS